MDLADIGRTHTRKAAVLVQLVPMVRPRCPDPRGVNLAQPEPSRKAVPRPVLRALTERLPAPVLPSVSLATWALLPMLPKLHVLLHPRSNFADDGNSRSAPVVTKHVR